MPDDSSDPDRPDDVATDYSPSPEPADHERSPEYPEGEPNSADESTPQGGEGPPPGRPVDENEQTRRQLLKAGAGVAAVGVVGFAYLRSQDDVGATTENSALDTVPDRSEFVFSWRGGEVLGNEQFQEVLDEELAALSVDEPTSTAELLDTIEARTAIEPRETGEVTAFGAPGSGSGEYAGMVFESSTAPETVNERLTERGVLLDTKQYSGHDLWVVGDDRLSWELIICALGDGQFGLGTRSEIEDVIDARGRAGRRVDSGVVQGFETSAGGLLDGGFIIPPSMFADLDLPIPVEQLANNIEYGNATIAEQPAGELTVTIVATDASAAEDVQDVLNGLSQIDRETIAEQVDGESAIVEVILTILADLETVRDGSEVTLIVTDGFRVFATAISYLVSEATGQ